MAEKKQRRERPAFNAEIAASIGKHYKDLQTNKPMAYALMAPDPLIEIAYAAGIQPAFPENYACICAARHASGGYCESAEAYDYSPDICSYCRNHFGYIYAPGEKPPMGGIGEPDLFLLPTVACTHYFKWWDALHEIFGKPLIFLNTPRAMEKEMPSYYLDYAMKEVEQAIADIEKVTGTKITNEKLSEAVRLSDEVTDYWQKILELNKTVPAPMNLSDLSNILFILIVLVGTQEGVDLIKKCYEETKQRVAEGKGILSKEEEKHRILWIDIPLWYRLGMLGYLENHGCVIPISDYTQYIWGTTRMDASKPVEGLARKALGGELNTSVDDQIDKMLKDIEEFHVDGVIALSNRSCRILSVGIPDATRIIREKFGIPTLVLDGDHTDERIFSEAEVMNRIDSFLEMLG